MNTVVDEVLAGSPRYNIKDNGGSSIYSNVQIDLATQVTTQGTPLNKALFDSIQSDLTNLSNNKLNVLDKATTAQSQAGTNDTKYITPSKLKDRQTYLTQTVELSALSNATEQTLFDFSTATGNVVEISGLFYNSNTSSVNPQMNFNGTNVLGASQNSYGVTTYYQPRNSTSGFYFRFDLTSKSFIGYMEKRGATSSTISEAGVLDFVVGHFTTLTSITAILRGGTGNGKITATITQNY